MSPTHHFGAARALNKLQSLESGTSSSSSSPTKSANKRDWSDSEYEDEGDLEMINKSEALRMYAKIGLTWEHLETIPVEKVPNPNGGKWPMKLYDPTELEQLAREVQNGTWKNPRGSSPKKTSASTSSPSKAGKPAVIAGKYAMSSFWLTEKDLSVLSYSELPNNWDSCQGPTRLYNLAEVHGLCVATHGQARFEELLPVANALREQRSNKSYWNKKRRYN